jgi:hypothetical protein
MSYDDTPHYVREALLKNRLDALLKPVVGILPERNAPSYLRNDTLVCAFRFNLTLQLKDRQFSQTLERCRYLIASPGQKRTELRKRTRFSNLVGLYH